jgi:cobalamin biosynthetic protein CobC
LVYSLLWMAFSMLDHGGRLILAANHYGIEVEHWLDLSTGINPAAWPVPEIPRSAWSRLPEDDDGLEQAARDYYDAEALLPVAGSQAAIQALPKLRKPGRVAVIHPGYAEHARAWKNAGHEVTAVEGELIDQWVTQVDVLVIIHPNNPTGARFSLQQLLGWHRSLSARGGWLVVDEAFMDVTPEHSVVPYSHKAGLIVLRSLGKFFGLAGARVGFVCAQPELLRRLQSLLGPWTVATPARWLARKALNDRCWQQATRQTLQRDAVRLRTLLDQYGLRVEGGCALFLWVKTADAPRLHAALARLGILTRIFVEPASLRFGLPDNERDWQRLDSALQQLTTVDRTKISTH